MAEVEAEPELTELHSPRRIGEVQSIELDARVHARQLEQRRERIL